MAAIEIFTEQGKKMNSSPASNNTKNTLNLIFNIYKEAKCHNNRTKYTKEREEKKTS